MPDKEQFPDSPSGASEQPGNMDVNLSARRELKNGFGDALSAAFEMVLTPAILGAIGFLIDRWLGTLPVFTITLAVFTLGYELWKAWVRYEADMDRHERELRGGSGQAGQ